MVWRISEVLDRAETGPICSEKDFDLKILLPKLKDVIKKYDIHFDPENIVVDDDSLVNNVWKAAVELYLDVGTFITTTNRRVLFEKDEIEEAMGTLPGKITVGSGIDARDMFHREVEDTRRPFCRMNPGCVCDEDIFLPMCMAYLQEPMADGTTAPILGEIEGRNITVGGPLEIKASVAHAMMYREAARRVGRPGTYKQGVGTAVSDAAQIAASNQEWGETLTDVRAVSSLAELKIDYSTLNKMMHYHTYGSIAYALSGPLLGGYAGGPEGTAVVGTAYHIMGTMVNQGNFTVYFPTDLKEGCNTTRRLLWVVSVSHQAVSKNSKALSLANGFAAAGPCTKMVLYEGAAYGLTSTVSGASALGVLLSARNRHRNRASPIEARLCCQAGCGAAATGLSRKDTNELVKTLLSKYEQDIPNAPLGKQFQECYDVKSLRPTPEHRKLYSEVKQELKDLGVPFSY
ncbi:MAG TPA: monomethylamine:corrinoid methyltransferase [Candidatus Bathyarchaeia archaeon]|nr:monomethylamine:corrinoid methyltransferase [Candidatus Bathyarchaeia archaeon]